MSRRATDRVPEKRPGCAANLYGTPKGWLAALGVLLGRSLSKRKVRGIHSISAYVQAIMRRDFLGNGEQTNAIAEAIIPSFREDEADQQATADAQTQRLSRSVARRKVHSVCGCAAPRERRQPVAGRLCALSVTAAAGPDRYVRVRFTARVSIRRSVLEKVPHRAVMAIWERSLFGVIPSLAVEPLGSVVYEGMSRGKAVIGTTPGGHTEYDHPG